jgi:hypothetical protein
MSMDVVPVANLTRPSDRFICKPYACTLTAASCGARQARARAAATVTEKLATRHCRACPDAARVIELSGAAVALTDRPKAPPVPPRARAPRTAAPAPPPPPLASATEMQHEALANRAAEQDATAARATPAATPHAPRTCAWAGPPTCGMRAGPVHARTPAALADYCPHHRSRARRMQLLAARELERAVVPAEQPAAPPPAPPAPCDHPDGCTFPAAAVHKQTVEAQRGWCLVHRQRARTAKSNRDRRERENAHIPPQPRTSEPAATIVDAARITAAHAYLLRALDVIEKLGGIDRAEKLAAALGAP